MHTSAIQKAWNSNQTPRRYDAMSDFMPNLRSLTLEYQISLVTQARLSPPLGDLNVCRGVQYLSPASVETALPRLRLAHLPYRIPLPKWEAVNYMAAPHFQTAKSPRWEEENRVCWDFAYTGCNFQTLPNPKKTSTLLDHRKIETSVYPSRHTEFSSTTYSPGIKTRPTGPAPCPRTTGG